MEAMINEENFIGVYPNGIHNTWNSGVISDDDDYIKPDDYGFTIKMIDWMRSNTRIDENRIFAFGQSAGAMFLYEQVVSRQHDFAAIGLIMGNYYDCEKSSVVIERCLEERPLNYPDQPREDNFPNGVTRYKYYDCNDYREIIVYAVYSAGHGNFEEYLPPGVVSDGVITLMWDFFTNNQKNKLFDLGL